MEFNNAFELVSDGIWKVPGHQNVTQAVFDNVKALILTLLEYKFPSFEKEVGELLCNLQNQGISKLKYYS